MTSHLLQQIEDGLKKFPEDVEPNNDDLIFPSFNAYYRKISRNKFTLRAQKLLESYGITAKAIFSPFNFSELLTHVVAQQAANFVKTREINLSEDTRLIIFGDLQGAAHSLMRSLKKLHDLKVIDSSLILQNANDFLLINGNFIGASHTNFETLIIIFYLMLANPEHVICTQGKPEQLGEWRNFDLKFALKERCRIFDSVGIPLAAPLDTFFDSLPHDIFFAGQRNIYVTPVRPESHVIFERKIDAVITGRDRRFYYSFTKGLEEIHSEAGAIEWSQFSAPTYVNQRLYQFHYDAFSILQTHNDEYLVYSRDIHTTEDFAVEKFHLLTGDPFDKVLHSDTRTKLVVGVTMDLSETASILGMRLREGIEIGFHSYNEGAHRFLIAPIFLNDKYTPYLSTQNIAIFREKYQTDLVFSSLGTPTTAACLPLVTKKEIIMLFPYSGARIFRAPELEYIVHIRASYESEARALIKHADETLKLKRFAFFYQNDAYGKEPLNAAIELIKDRPDIEYITASYMRNNPTTHVAAAKIIEFDPEAIFFFSTYAPSCALIHEINVDRLSGKFLLGISFLTDLIRTFCRHRGLEFIISRVTPPQNDRRIPIVNDFYKALSKEGDHTTPSVDVLEGYIAARLFADVVESISGEITKEALWQAFKKMQNYNFRGLSLTFNESTKELYSDVWIDTGAS